MGAGTGGIVRVAMPLVTPEPCLAHIGLDGVGDARRLMESAGQYLAWSVPRPDGPDRD